MRDRGVSSTSATQDFSFWRPQRASSHTSSWCHRPCRWDVPAACGCATTADVSWCHRSRRPGRTPGRDLLDKLTPSATSRDVWGLFLEECVTSAVAQDHGRSQVRVQMSMGSVGVQIPSGPNPVPIRTRRRFLLTSPCSKHRKFNKCSCCHWLSQNLLAQGS